MRSRIRVAQLCCQPPRPKLISQFGLLRFEVATVGDKPTADIIKDTINVPKNITFEVDFITNNGGLSLVHCYTQQHMDFGFKALVKYH